MLDPRIDATIIQSAMDRALQRFHSSMTAMERHRKGTLMTPCGRVATRIDRIEQTKHYEAACSARVEWLALHHILSELNHGTHTLGDGLVQNLVGDPDPDGALHSDILCSRHRDDLDLRDPLLEGL